MSKNGFAGTVQIPAQMKKQKPKTTPSKPVDQRSAVKNIPAQVISQTPGRLRLRVGVSDRSSISNLEQTLNAHPDIKEVRTNNHHGSITIHHNLDNADIDAIKATLQDVGMIIGDIINIGEGRSAAANSVTSAVIDLNQRVKRSTHGEVDLRVLFPLGLACLSARQLLIKGLQLEIIPWYVLAWYAFDSFLKLHTASLSSER